MCDSRNTLQLFWHAADAHCFRPTRSHAEESFSDLMKRKLQEKRMQDTSSTRSSTSTQEHQPEQQQQPEQPIEHTTPGTTTTSSFDAAPKKPLSLKRRLVDEQREKYKKRRLTSPERKRQALEKLNLFQKTLRQASVEQAKSDPEHSTSTTTTAVTRNDADDGAAIAEDESLNSDRTWLTHQLEFEKTSQVRVCRLESPDQ
jgi:hypothetical protein